MGQEVGLLVREYFRLLDGKAAVDKQAKHYDTLIEEKEEEILAALVEAGVSGSKVAGVGSVYIRPKLKVVPKAGQSDAAQKALDERGMSDFFKKRELNVTRLGNYVKEQREQGEELPDWFVALFDVRDSDELGYRRG